MQEQSKVEQAKVGLTGGAAPQREHLTLDSARRVMLRPVRPDEDVDELFAAGHPPGVSTVLLCPLQAFSLLTHSACRPVGADAARTLQGHHRVPRVPHVRVWWGCGWLTTSG